jgi:V/A-type H+-transporting ATPase subunit I
MIVNLHKYLFIGSKSEMDRFFFLSQKAGFLEFIGLSKKQALEMPEDAKKLISAIKIARAHTANPHEPFRPELGPVPLAEQIIQWNEEHEKQLEEQRILQAEIARIAPFGDFSRSELDKFELEGKRSVQFFCMKGDLASDFKLPPNMIYVGTEYDLAYFVAINKEKSQYPKMIEITIDHPVGELRDRLLQLNAEIAQVEHEIHESAKALPYLQNGLLDYLNAYHLQMAKHDAASPMGDSLFAIEAWVPKTKIKAMQGLLSGLDVHAEEICIEEKDRIPTCQENKGAGKIGEDLVHIYDNPAHSDKDPSLWVLIFFSLFFAMIVSDAGYGLIYLLIGLFLKWKFKKASGLMNRFIKLILIASTSCIIWGIFTASFFGLEIGPNNPYRKVSLLHYLATRKAEYHMEKKDDVYEEYVKEYPAVATATDGHDFFLKASHESEGHMKYEALTDFYDSLLLEISLLVGTIHICLSFLRYMRRNWTAIGWIFFMIGGYLYFPSFVNATSILNFMGLISKATAYAVGKQMLFAGLILVFVIALLQKKKWGALHELTNAIQVFADVLSYIRLYALALAGMIMASTFNELAVQVGLVGGFFVIVIGHAVNLVLTVMSGVIHGLRLNFLEWYHYCFEGGGRLFDPLRIRKAK